MSKKLFCQQNGEEGLGFLPSRHTGLSKAPHHHTRRCLGWNPQISENNPLDYSEVC
jgi:hypothetical protein